MTKPVAVAMALGVLLMVGSGMVMAYRLERKPLRVALLIALGVLIPMGTILIDLN